MPLDTVLSSGNNTEARRAGNHFKHSMNNLLNYIRTTEQVEALHALRGSVIHPAWKTTVARDSVIAIGLTLASPVIIECPDVLEGFNRAMARHLPAILEEIEKHVTTVITAAAKAATGEASRVIARGVE